MPIRRSAGAGRVALALLLLALRAVALPEAPPRCAPLLPMVGADGRLIDANYAAEVLRVLRARNGAVLGFGRTENLWEFRETPFFKDNAIRVSTYRDWEVPGDRNTYLDEETFRGAFRERVADAKWLFFNVGGLDRSLLVYTAMRLKNGQDRFELNRNTTAWEFLTLITSEASRRKLSFLVDGRLVDIHELALTLEIPFDLPLRGGGYFTRDQARRALLHLIYPRLDR